MVNGEREWLMVMPLLAVSRKQIQIALCVLLSALCFMPLCLVAFMPCIYPSNSLNSSHRSSFSLIKLVISLMRTPNCCN